MPEQAPSQIAQYRIVGRAGRWARGWLYRGHDLKIDRRALVKTLSATAATDKESLLRFQREARVTAALNHPNIVDVFELGVHNDEPFLAFEALEGQSLLQLMNAGMKLTVGLPIMMQVLDGLASMHAKGIIHRDIKPACIFVCKDGRAKITDLWMVALFQPRMKPSWTGLFLGTPSYMSPDHLRGEVFDGRADQFSLGSVLYEMASGRKPFGDEASSALLFRIASEEPAMEAIPHGTEWERLRGVIRRALQKKPEDRYPDAGAMRDELKLALKELGESADWSPPPSGEPAPTHLH